MIDQTNDNKQGEEKTDVSGDPIKELNERLEKCLKEKEDYLNGWKRAKADLINYQKDEARRFEEVLKFGNIELIKDFIPVLDSFAALERTLEGEPLASLDASRSGRPDNQSGRDLADVVGFRLIRIQLDDLLKKSGLERIITKPGQSFDPAFHESVGEIESGEQPGSIAHEIESGYTLNGRVVRPARVKLAKVK